MMDLSSHELDRLVGIFLPHLFAKQEGLKANNTRLVHYCSAASAMSIFRSKSFWMRNSKCMNDFLELEHGLECLISAWGRKGEESKFKAALDGLFPKVSEEIEERFNEWVPLLKSGTYISCFSEHSNEEDTLGRLSMWRAYGRSAGVALVMKNAPFIDEAYSIDGLFVSAVDYTDDAGVRSLLKRVAGNIEKDNDFLRGYGKELTFNAVFQMLLSFMICTKHPGFAEEKEWRVIYCPALQENKQLRASIELIDNIPQTVHKIPLKEGAKSDQEGVGLGDLVDRVTIGPTEYPTPLYDAFVELLGQAGVEKPHEKVFTSQIPLRT